MNYHIDSIKKTRFFLLDLIKELTLDQLNEVPEGFNNNILWNLAHLISAQQGLCYSRSGVPPIVDDQLIQSYKNGTKPEGPVSAEYLEQVKQLLISTIDQLEVDYSAQLFTHYIAWITRYKVELTNIDDAISFLKFHEGLHTGYIMALKRAVKK